MTDTRTVERPARVGVRVAHRHAEDPDHPGVALCGARLRGGMTGEGSCPMCEAIINGGRSWVAR